MPFKWCAHRFICFYCGCSFANSTKLKEHNEDEHSTVKLGNLLRSLHVRRSIKLDITDVSCKACPKPFTSFDDLLHHLTQEHKILFDYETRKLLTPFKLSDESTPCPECGKDFSFFGTLLVHMNRVHLKRAKSFLCEKCGEGFSSKMSVKRHVELSHTDAEHKCLKCGKAFTSSYFLHIHLKEQHGGLKPIKCAKCPEMFNSHYLLKGHLAAVHDFKDYKLPCGVCKKTFVSKSRLDVHVRRVHLRERTFICQECGFKAFNGDHLSRHMVRHSDNRPFECDICKKAFQRKRTLTFHKRIHTNDKQYQCKVCGRAFIQLSSLKLHVKVHHGN